MANPTLVQSANLGNGTGTQVVTLGVTPTVGNVLYAIVGNNALGSPGGAVNSGWIAFSATQNGAFPTTDGVRVAYRVVQAGDTVSQTPFTGCHFGQLSVFEVSGSDPVHAVESLQITGAGGAITHVTAASGDLALFAAGISTAGSPTTVTLTGSSWANVESNTSADGGACGTLSVPSAGTTITASTSPGTFFNALIVLSVLPAGEAIGESAGLATADADGSYGGPTHGSAAGSAVATGRAGSTGTSVGHADSSVRGGVASHGSSVGVGAASAASDVGSRGASPGVGAASGVTASLQKARGASVGVGAVQSYGPSRGVVTGIAVVAGKSAHSPSSVGSAAGSASAHGTPVAPHSGIGTSTGVARAGAIAPIYHVALGSSAGVAHAYGWGVANNELTYAEYFLNYAANVVQLELLEIAHPFFTRTYRVVRNCTKGVTVTHEDGTVNEYLYYPVKIVMKTTADDLDQGMTVTFGDLGEVLPLELDSVQTNDGFQIKPTITYRTYRSDDPSFPLFGPIFLEVTSFSFKREGATFDAAAPLLNYNQTGELFALDRFPGLRGVLMAFSVDPYFGREYHERDYNCLHFVRDVWLDLTGDDVGDRLALALDESGGPLLRGARRARALGAFEPLDGPVDPCIALMQRRNVAPHAGVYIAGRILHLYQLGVEFQEPDVASRGFTSVGYYR